MLTYLEHMPAYRFDEPVDGVLDIFITIKRILFWRHRMVSFLHFWAVLVWFRPQEAIARFGDPVRALFLS